MGELCCLEFYVSDYLSALPTLPALELPGRGVERERNVTGASYTTLTARTNDRTANRVRCFFFFSLSLDDSAN